MRTRTLRYKRTPPSTPLSCECLEDRRVLSTLLGPVLAPITQLLPEDHLVETLIRVVDDTTTQAVSAIVSLSDQVLPSNNANSNAQGANDTDGSLLSPMTSILDSVMTDRVLSSPSTYPSANQPAIAMEPSALHSAIPSLPPSTTEAFAKVEETGQVNISRREEENTPARSLASEPSEEDTTPATRPIHRAKTLEGIVLASQNEAPAISSASRSFDSEERFGEVAVDGSSWTGTGDAMTASMLPGGFATWWEHLSVGSYYTGELEIPLEAAQAVCNPDDANSEQEGLLGELPDTEGAGLVNGAMTTDATALQLAVQQFLAHLDDLGRELTEALSEGSPTAWAIALMLGTTVVAGQRLQRRKRSYTNRSHDGLSATWLSSSCPFSADLL